MAKELDVSNEDVLSSILSTLDDIPTDRLQRVAEMLELMGDNSEVETVLSAVRARLAAPSSSQLQALQHLVYRPIEDALVNEPGKYAGYVSWKSMAMAWAQLKTTTEADRLQLWEARIVAVSGQNSPDEKSLEEEIWAWASRELKQAVDNALVDRAARRAMFGTSPELLGELQLAVRLFDVAPQIRELKSVLPLSPSKAQIRESRYVIRHIMLNLGPESVDRMHVILLTVMFRLAVPGELLEELPAILRSFPPGVKSEIQKRLTTFVMADLNRRAEIATAPEADLKQRMTKAELLAVALGAAQRTAVPGDRDIARRLGSVRAEATKLLSELLESAERAVRDSVDMDGPWSPQTIRCAEDGVNVLRQIRRISAIVGLEAIVRTVIERTTDHVRASVNRLMDTMTRGALSGTNLESARGRLLGMIGLERYDFWLSRTFDLPKMLCF